MYFDAAYVAKFYLNEPDSVRVRVVANSVPFIRTSELTLVEFRTVLHRNIREGLISVADARSFSARFERHMSIGLWRAVPADAALLRRTAQMLLVTPPTSFLRAADAIHIMSAREAGEAEVWTSDRHMLNAAPLFGLTGRSA